MEGFAAYSGVRFDVRREDLAGEWISGFLIKARHTFNPDGTGEDRVREMRDGPETVTPFRWDVKGDIFNRYSEGSPGAVIQGKIVRLEPAFFSVRYTNGTWGYSRPSRVN